ncbi:MAG TPA: hypothetical protein VGP25_11005 [Gemmatimonadaceae bacterium]|jgi:hypothetical protein|nr:hypothetical protein [Gemmatimonadaceae bacterium]
MSASGGIVVVNVGHRRTLQLTCSRHPMRSPLSPIALAAALFIAGCSGRSHDAERADSTRSHAFMTIPGSAAAPAALGEGDVRIVTADTGIDLALIGDTISSGLSEHALAKVRHETDTAAVAGKGFGADLEKLVKGTVQKAVGTRVGFPISDVRAVRYDGRAIVFEWAGKAPNIHGDAKVNGKPLLESFSPDDAKRFADAVMARKRAHGL